ncbi:MAG: hypothetical protein J5915_02265, partial [Acidaminococcaceae bacterium]|nr:hypothetical protein [Acidaminococcaceae bacterium]
FTVKFSLLRAGLFAAVISFVTAPVSALVSVLLAVAVSTFCEDFSEPVVAALHPEIPNRMTHVTRAAIFFLLPANKFCKLFMTVAFMLFSSLCCYSLSTTGGCSCVEGH